MLSKNKQKMKQFKNNINTGMQRKFKNTWRQSNLNYFSS